MPGQRPFGYRAMPKPSPPQVKPRPPAVASDRQTGPTNTAPKSLPPEGLSVDDELRAWKQMRKKAFQIPWRQLSVMAGLCFGIASLVLPDTVSDAFQWLLYALAAASFYAGFRKRKKI